MRAVRWLVVRSVIDPESVEAKGGDALVESLLAGGHEVRQIDLSDEDTRVCMTADEHRAYETIAADHPDPQVTNHIEMLRATDGLAFVFPTMWMVHAPLKGWLERTMLPDVAFRLDPTSRLLKPNLTNVKHLAVITSTEHRKKHRLAFGDPARRLVMRSIRSVCNPRCKTTWLSMYERSLATDADNASFVADVGKTFGSL